MIKSRTIIESGILALWRAGTAESVPGTRFDEQQRQILYTAGKIGMLTLLRSAYGEQGLDYPGISSITEHDFKGARDLNRAAHAADTEVLAVKFHGARRGEVDGMRHALAAGARMLMDDLQVVFRAPIVIGLHRSYEAALTPHAGALYVPEDTLAPIATQAAESLHLTLPVHTDSAAG